MSTAGSLNVRIKADFGELTRGLKQATQQVSAASRRMSESLKNVSQKLTGLGGEFSAKLTAPIGILGVTVLKMSGDFEQSMNRVAAVSGATGREFEALREKAKELGSTTAFSASQVADAMGFLSMAGLRASEQLGSISSVLNLASAAQIDMASAADIVTNIMSSQQMTTEELEHATNVLVKAFTSANTDLVQLGNAFKFAGPIAKTTGVQFEEAAAALSLMGNSGVQSTMAGRGLRMALLRLVKPPKEAAKSLKELGVEARELDGSIRPLADILDDLARAGADVPDYAAIFGTEAFGAMQALISQGTDTLRIFQKELENVGDVAQRIQEIQMQGLNGALRRMKSAFEGLAIAIGDSGLKTAMTNIAADVALFFEKLTKASPALLALGTALGGVLAAIGPLLLSLGALTWALGQLAAATSLTVGAIAGPLGLAVVTLSLVGTLLLMRRGVKDTGVSLDHFAGTLSRVHDINMELNKATGERVQRLKEEKRALLEKADAEISAAIAAVEAEQQKADNRTEGQKRRGIGPGDVGDAQSMLDSLQAARKRLQTEIEESEKQARMAFAGAARTRLQTISDELVNASEAQSVALKKERDQIMERVRADLEAEKARQSRMNEDRVALQATMDMLQHEKRVADERARLEQERHSSAKFGGGHRGRADRNASFVQVVDAAAKSKALGEEIGQTADQMDTLNASIDNSNELIAAISKTLGMEFQPAIEGVGEGLGGMDNTEDIRKALRQQIADLKEMALAALEGEDAMRRLELTQSLLADGWTDERPKLEALVNSLFDAEAEKSGVMERSAMAQRSQEALGDARDQIADIDALTEALGQGGDAYEDMQIKQQLYRAGVRLEGDALQALVEDIKRAQEAYQEASREARFWEDLGAAPTDSIRDWLMSGSTDLDDLMANFSERFRVLLIDALITKPFEDLAEQFAEAFRGMLGGIFTDGSMENWGQQVGAALRKVFSNSGGGDGGNAGWMQAVGNFFGSMFGGARAIGGPTMSNRIHLVGENGPELFIPSGSGTVEPMGAVSGRSGGGMTFNNTFNVEARADLQAMQRLVDESQKQMAGQINAQFDGRWDARFSNRVKHGLRFDERR